MTPPSIHSLKHQLKLALKRQNKAVSPRPPCPYCKHDVVHKTGIKNNTQFFRCTKCRKSYCHRTGTSFYWLKMPARFQSFANAILAGEFYTLRQTSEILNISVNTAFQWRHKVLSAIHCKPQLFKGMIELRNATLPFSRKGLKIKSMPANSSFGAASIVHLLLAADYSGNQGVDVLRIGKLQLNDLDRKLSGRLPNEKVIIAPFSEMLLKLNKQKKWGMTLFSNKHNPNNLFDHKTSNIQILLTQLAIYKTRGVATKYLPHYARWALIMARKQTEKNDLSIELMKHNNLAWTGFTALEQKFNSFSAAYSDELYIPSLKKQWKRAFLLAAPEYDEAE